MNTHRVLGMPMIGRMIVTLILLAASGVTILVAVVWLQIHVQREQAPSQADPWEVVDDLHVAINSNNADQVLALFTNDATITDHKTMISNKDQIRNWVLNSNQMAGLHLKMIHSDMDGEKLTWLDTAYNGPEGKSRYYILRWEAVITEGKIQSLVVIPRYMPDLK